MTIGYQGPDWAESALADVPQPKFHFAEIWPVGAGSSSTGGDKDPLEEGDHVFVAVGPKALRSFNTLVGVTSTVLEGTDNDDSQAELRIQPGEAFKAKISNVLTYDQGDPATFLTSLAIGQDVYVDDSDGLPDDVTLSFSPNNDQGNANPHAGIIWRGQRDFDDTYVGGFGAYTDFPVTIADELTEIEYVVLLTP